MNETDWFYYIALAIATFVVIYIIYISLQFQNNMMEGFSMGGGGADKGKSKGKDDSSAVGQSVDIMYEENTKIEEGLKLSDNKDEYKNMSGIELKELKKILSITYEVEYPLVLFISDTMNQGLVNLPFSEYNLVIME